MASTILSVFEIVTDTHRYALRPPAAVRGRCFRVEAEKGLRLRLAESAKDPLALEFCPSSFSTQHVLVLTVFGARNLR